MNVMLPAGATLKRAPEEAPTIRLPQGAVLKTGGENVQPAPQTVDLAPQPAPPISLPAGASRLREIGTPSPLTIGGGQVQGQSSDQSTPFYLGGASTNPQPDDGHDSWVTLGAKVVQNAPDMIQQSVGGLLRGIGEMPLAAPVPGAESWPEFQKEQAVHQERVAAPGGLDDLGARIYGDASTELAANAPNVDPNSLKRYAYDITQGIVQMGPMLAASMATKSPVVGLSMMAGQVGGQEYGQSRADGRTPTQSASDAGFYALAETIPEAIPLGILMKPGQRFLTRTLKSAGAEGVQEMFTQILQTGYDAGVIGEDMTWGEAIRQVIDAGIVGTGVGGGLAVASHPFAGAGEAAPVEAPLQPEIPLQVQTSPAAQPDAPAGVEPPPFPNEPLQIAPESIAVEPTDDVVLPEGAVLADTIIPAPPVEDVPQIEANTTRPELSALLDDPRPLEEIKAEREAAQNWTPTADWQDVPVGAQVGPDIEVRETDAGQQARVAPPQGSREAPVALDTPEAVNLGAERTVEPTPAQAKAGNYPKRHLKWNGLDLTIETEAGQERTGISPDGKPWSVTMPAPYGYVKRTEGADGDHIDIYVGPQPASPSVFVVDQIEPETKGHDEHKVMLGYPDAKTAMENYHAAFSDGSGPQRVGAITQMTVQEFKGWLANADTTKPLSYEKPVEPEAPAVLPPEARADINRLVLSTKKPINPAIIAKRLKVDEALVRRHLLNMATSESSPIRAKTTLEGKSTFVRKPKLGPLSLMQFIASKGGLRDEAGELKARDLDKKFLLGFGKLVRPNGLSFDDARELAEEAGYIRSSQLNSTSSINDFLDALDTEIRGTKVHAAEDIHEVADRESVRVAGEMQDRYGDGAKEITALANQHGIDLDDETALYAAYLVDAERMSEAGAITIAFGETAISYADNLAMSAQGFGLTDGREIPFSEYSELDANEAQNRETVPRDAQGQEIRDEAPRDEPRAAQVARQEPAQPSSVPAGIDAGAAPESPPVRAEPRPDQRNERGAGEEVTPDKGQPQRTASWILKDKTTGEVVMETFDRKKVDALNTEKYVAVPIHEYLASLNAPKAEPTVEKTEAGQQTVIAGAEKISDKSLAERKMAGGKRASVAQKPADDGLFDTGARKQTDLLDAVKAAPVKVEAATTEQIGRSFEEAQALKALNRLSKIVNGKVKEANVLSNDEKLSLDPKPFTIPVAANEDLSATAFKYKANMTALADSLTEYPDVAKAVKALIIYVDKHGALGVEDLQFKVLTRALDREVEAARNALKAARDMWIEAPRAPTSFHNQLLQRMIEVGIDDRVSHRLVADIKATANGKTTSARGRYTRGLIEIALHSKNKRWVLDHEIVHALRDLGLFTPQEWRTLARTARLDDGRMTSVRKLYAPLNLSEAELVEEAIADMFADWAAGKGIHDANAAGIMGKIRVFFEALARALFKIDIQTASQIFGAVDRGEFGTRAKNIAGEGVSPKLAAAYHGEGGNTLLPREDAAPKADTDEGPMLKRADDSKSSEASADNLTIETRTPFSGKFLEKAESLYPSMRDRLDKIGLGKVGLKLADTIETWVNGKAGVAEGMFMENVITVALDRNQKIIDTAFNHEALHGLRRLGLFTDAEWNILTQKSNQTWRGQYDVATHYAEFPEWVQIEEGIAQAFGEWASNTGKFDGRVVRLFKRIADFFDALKNALNGLGFTSAGQIFERIERGEMATRAEAKAGNGKENAVTRFMVRTPKAANDNEIGAADEKLRTELRKYLDATPESQDFNAALADAAADNAIFARGWQSSGDGDVRLILNEDYDRIAEIKPLKGGGFGLKVIDTHIPDRFASYSEAVAWVLGDEMSSTKPDTPMFSLTEQPKTSVERADVMQGFIGRGQPIDRALRIPFDIFGGVDTQGRWKPGVALFDKASKIITEAKFDAKGRFAFANPVMEVARRGLVDRYGLSAEYVTRDRDRALDERAVMMQGTEVLKTLRDHAVGPEEAKVLQAILTGEAVDDVAMQKLAEPIRKSIDLLGQEAVELGLLSAESFERNRGAYLHRVYLKNEADQDGLTKTLSSMMGKRRKKIIGEQFKGRGMFLEVLPVRLMKDLPEFAKGEIGIPPKGEKFRILDEYAHQSEMDVGEGGKPKPVRRVYWPEGKSVPARYADFTDNGVWEIRGKKGGQLVLWRDFTKPERSKMGEIMDARYTITKTYMLMAHDLATGKFYKDIATHPEWASSEAPNEKWIDAAEWARTGQRFIKRDGVEWVKVPSTELAGTGGKLRWGALSGKYVREEIWRDINELEVLSRPNVWRKLLTSWKLMKTARSPVVHMNNVVSNFLFMDMADVRMQDLHAGVRAFAEGEGNADYDEAFANGAFGGDAMTQEIRNNILKPLLDEMTETTGTVSTDPVSRMDALGKVAQKIFGYAKWADGKMIDAYRMEDEIFRMASYMRRRSLGDTPKQAADFARQQFIDYDIRAPWVNMARNSVLPFISYTYRAAPLVAKAMAHHPWKLAKYAMIAQAVNMLGYMLTGDDDEDRERRSLRDTEQGYTWVGAPRMIRMPFNDQYGNPTFLDVRRWIPAGDIFDTQGNDMPAWLNLGGPLLLGAELFLNRSGFTGQDITNTEINDFWERSADRGSYLWKAWMPSAAWVPYSWYWDKIANAIYGATDYSGRPYGIGNSVASSIGIKLKPQDVEDGMSWKAFEFSKTERALKDEARRISKRHERGILSDKEFNQQMMKIMEKVETLNEKRKETLKP